MGALRARRSATSTWNSETLALALLNGPTSENNSRRLEDSLNDATAIVLDNYTLIAVPAAMENARYRLWFNRVTSSGNDRRLSRMVEADFPAVIVR